MTQFYTFDTLHHTPTNREKIVPYSMLLKSAGFTPEIRVDVEPAGRDSLLLRIANTNDVFDSNGEVGFSQIKLNSFC